MSKKMIVLVGWLLVLFLIFSGCSPQKEGQNAEANNNESTAQPQLDIQDKIKDVMTSLEKENSQKNDNPDNTALKDLGYEVIDSSLLEDEKPASVITNMKLAFMDGKLSEHDYHVQNVSIVYDSEYFIGLYGNKIQQESIDISISLQWMLDHQDELDKRESEMLEKAVIPSDLLSLALEKTQACCIPEENKNPSSLKLKAFVTNAVNSLFPVAYAEGSEFGTELFDAPGYKYKSAILYDKNSLTPSHLALIKNTIYIGGGKFQEIHGIYDEKLVVYVNSGMPDCIQSKFYSMQGLRILEINSGLNVRDLVGIILEELFYIFSEMSVNTDVSSLEIEWLREATSAWGVNYAFKSLDYEHKYVPYIYNNIDTPYFALSTEKAKSWYQFFLYVTDVLGHSSYVKDIYDLLSEHTGNPGMNLLMQAGTNEEGFRNYMAMFFMCLAGADDTTGSLKSVDNVPNFTLIAEEAFRSEDVKKMKLSDWKLADMMPGDNYHIMIGTSGLDTETGLNILNNMGETISKTAGMAIGIMKNDKMTWKMIPTNEMTHYSLDLKNNPADYIHIMLFNSSMTNVSVYQYAIGAENFKTGSGKITVNYSEKWNNADESGQTTINWDVDEKLEKLSLKGSEELQGLLNAMVGESYLVKEMAADYRFEQHITKKSSHREETTKATGIFFYNSTEEAGTGLDFGNLLPGGDDLQSQLDEALGMMEGIEGLEGFSEADLELTIDEEDLGLSDLNEDEMNAVKGLMKAVGSIPRFRFDSSIDSLMFYPGMPPEMLNEEWLEGTETIRITDEDGNVEEDQYDIGMSPPEIFPQWFVNPNAEAGNESTDDNESMLDADSLDTLTSMGYMPDDLKGIMDRIKGISDTGNAVNMMTINRKGVVTLDIDGLGKGGVIIETILYTGKELFAKLIWKELSNGVEYNCEIEMNYQFQ